MLQLRKSIRLERLHQPVKQGLQMASQLGVDAVELNARTEVRPADMSRTAVRHLLKLLADLNLQVSALHFPTRRGYEVTDDLDQRLDATRKAMDLAYELGCSVVVNSIGHVPESNDDPRWNTLIQAMTDLGRHAHRTGAWLAATTSTVSGPDLQRVIAALPSLAIGVDFDPADLLIHGYPVAETMRQLGEQVMSFRARDAVRDLSLGQNVEVQLGRGSVDWPELFGILEQNQYPGFVTVDRQFSDQFLAESQQALQFLDRLFE